MKPLHRALPLAPMLVVLVLGTAGCATYHYTPQKDAATVKGTEPPIWLLGLGLPREVSSANRLSRSAPIRIRVLKIREDMGSRRLGDAN